MKQRKQRVLWAATILGLALAPGLVRGQDNSVSSEIQRATSTMANKLGRVERANKVIGREVMGSDNQKLGKIDNFVIDLNSGRILYAVIGGGGLLGVEQRRLAVPPSAFTQTESDTVQLSVDKEKFLGGPRFTSENERAEALDQPSYLQQVYEYYGRQNGWNSAETSVNHAQRASKLIGTRLDNASNERIGKVEDLGIDLAMGRAVYVIVSPASRLNLGDNYLALPPSTLTWNADQKALNCDLPSDKLSGAPRFSTSDWSNLSNPTFALQVYSYYGKQFEHGPRPTGRSDELLPNKSQR